MNFVQFFREKGIKVTNAISHIGSMLIVDRAPKNRIH